MGTIGKEIKKAQAVIHIGLPHPGRYDFIGEYHEETAKGRMVAE
jgi:hypothetical protein